jgi:hypothetical protein
MGDLYLYLYSNNIVIIKRTAIRWYFIALTPRNLFLNTHNVCSSHTISDHVSNSYKTLWLKAGNIVTCPEHVEQQNTKEGQTLLTRNTREKKRQTELQTPKEKTY